MTHITTADIWNDPDGVWLEHNKTLYGPYESEAQAEEAFRQIGGASERDGEA